MLILIGVDVEIELEECPFEKYDSVQMDLFARRRSEGDPNSSSRCSFDLAAWWLNECKSKHKRCYQSTSTLPSRVIDVGPPDGTIEPRLYESKAESAPYLALSHCWGDALPLTTTINTLPKRKKQILMTELPATFRDAVIIARRFGVRFLWIDSLCILQDSVKDWEIESANMCKIYQNSHFTIAVAHARDGTEGCFTQRDGFLNQPHLFQRSGSPSPSLWAARLGTDTTWSTITASPLSNRAWAYQEQMISRRTLYYNTDGVAWRCSSSKASEANPDLSIGIDDTSQFQQKFLASANSEFRADIDPLERFEYADYLMKTIKGVLAPWKQPEKQGKDVQEANFKVGESSLLPAAESSMLAQIHRMQQREELNRLLKDSPVAFLNAVDYLQIMEGGPLRRSKWHEIVEEYTSRCLTRSSDRLAALAGISDAVSQLTGETYIGGIWQSRSKNVLFLDLVWSVKQTKTPSTSQKQGTIERAPLLRTGVAPSWSWASVDGPIQYPGHDGVLLSAMALEAEISEKAASRFSGTLRGRGWIYPARTSGRPSDSKYNISIPDAPNSKLFRDMPQIQWFPDEPIPPYTDIWLVELAHVHHESSKLGNDPCKTVYALGLRPAAPLISVSGSLDDYSALQTFPLSQRENKPLRRVGLASWPAKLFRRDRVVSKSLLEKFTVQSCFHKVHDARSHSHGHFIRDEPVFWASLELPLVIT
jgi:hypothetical protein